MQKSQDHISQLLRLTLRENSILRIHQVAAILHVSCRTVRHLALTGKLRGYKTGPRIWTFHSADVEAYANRYMDPLLNMDGWRCPGQRI